MTKSKLYTPTQNNLSPNPQYRVLAIDPGYERVGIAVLEKKGTQKETLIYSECFKTSPTQGHDMRLASLGTHIKKIIATHSPTDMALEQLFFNTNQTTALKVAEARGVLIYEAAQAGVEIYEYTPLEIKIAVTGYGRSTKDQVTEMVKRLVPIASKKTVDDEYDAVAIGITHISSKRFFSRT